MVANGNARLWVEGCRCRVEDRTAAFRHSPPKTCHTATGPIGDVQRSGNVTESRPHTFTLVHSGCFSFNLSAISAHISIENWS